MKDIVGEKKNAVAFSELEKSVYHALETYSNVHRGSGHYSVITTSLFEKARDIILEYLQLNKEKYSVVFCTPAGSEYLKSQLNPEDFHCLSSKDIGLSVGVRAMAVNKKSMPGGIPFQTGGGTTKLVSKDWVIWADAPDRFEAGTPSVINIIAFAKALLLVKKYGENIIKDTEVQELTVSDILYNDELVKYSGKELLEKLRKTLVGYNYNVPTMEGVRPFINFDNSASTPAFEPVWNAFRQTLLQSGIIKQEIIKEVRSVCSKVLNAPQEEYDIIFTSNTTDAINLAARGLAAEVKENEAGVVVNSLLEHSSNELPWRTIANSTVIRMPVDDYGFIDIKELEKVLESHNRTGLHGNKRVNVVSISGASNVLGVCNDISEISSVVHRYGARLMVDAAQLVAHRSVDMEKWGIDYLAFSAHKVYAPFGCGVLVARKGMLKLSSEEMKAVIISGEENAGGIAALGKSLILLQRIGMDVIRNEEQELTKKLLLGMSKIPGLSLFGINNPGSEEFAHKLGVVVFKMKNIMPNSIARTLAVQYGIGIRYGCHCAHIIIKHLLGVKPTLEKLQRIMAVLLPEIKFPGLARVSLGIENTSEEVDRFLYTLDKIAQKETRSSLHNKKLTKALVVKQINNLVKESVFKVYNQQ